MAEGPQSFHPNEHIEVTLRMLGTVSAHVVWRLPDRLGIAFDQPINPKAARIPVSGPRN
jgi:hypothetical protein